MEKPELKGICETCNKDADSYATLRVDLDSRKKDGLMQRLTSLLSKKSPTKPSITKPSKAIKRVIAPTNFDHLCRPKNHALVVNSDRHANQRKNGGTNFEAQGEATHKELLLKADRDGPPLVKTRSRSAPSAWSNVTFNDDANPGMPGGTLSSRLWQHVGSKLFCGTATSASIMAKEMPLAMSIHDDERKEGPLYFGDGAEDEYERYWQQALTEAIMLRSNSKAREFGDDDYKDQHRLSIAEDIVSEIQQDSENLLPALSSGLCRRMSVSFDNSQYNMRLQPASSRLNTRLEDSPQLIHNYSTKLKGPAMTMSFNESSSCSSLWSSAASSSCMPMARVRSKSSGTVDIAPVMNECVCAKAPSLPLQKLLTEARFKSSSLSLINCADKKSQSMAREKELSGFAQVSSTCCRVSLHALMHEEEELSSQNAATNCSPQVDACSGNSGEDEDEEHSLQLRAAGAVALEDPLLCCVCLVDKKGAAFIPCGHTFCRSCTKELFAGRGMCPLCNNVIVQVLDIF